MRMDSAPHNVDDLYASGFYQAAASLGVNPNILGARLDMRAEKATNNNDKLPDFMFFRGRNTAKGEYGYALTEKSDSPLGNAFQVTHVAWRYIARVLGQQGNTHLLESAHILEDMTEPEFERKLIEASREPNLPQHIREILVEAARRNRATLQIDNDPIALPGRKG